MVLAASKSFVVKNPLTVVAGIVTLVALLVTLISVFAISGNGLSENAKLIIISSIIGLVVNAIPSLLSLYKSEATQHDIRNGVVKDKVKDAIVEMAEDTDTDGVYIKTTREGDSDG